MWSRFKRIIRAVLRRGPYGPPPEVGLPGLAPCPETPNCVCSRSGDAVHFVEPIAWHRPESAIDAAARIVSAHPRAAVQERTQRYLHATYRIPLLGFVDDVEFLWEDDVLHVRSASRVGRRDLGVNRRRLERFRRDLRR